MLVCGQQERHLSNTFGVTRKIPTQGWLRVPGGTTRRQVYRWTTALLPLNPRSQIEIEICPLSRLMQPD
jgi:hypothetical protein